MSDLYREQLLDHYENPRHHGELTHADISHEEHNPLCGDQIKISANVNDTANALAEVVFTGDGCIISQAAASMLLEATENMPLETIEKLEPQFVLDLIGIPLTANRVKCALLSLKTLKTGVKLWRLSHTHSN
jgi:nitrogen fixation NifU-like protein